MIWNEKYETMSREDMQAHQLSCLKKLVDNVYNKVPFYKKRMDEMGVKPSDIQTLADIRKLPFTTKYDMRDTYPFGLLACGMDEILEVHASSGTTGKPVVVAYTQNDLDIWSEVVARTLTMGGVGKDDIIQNAYGYGLFTGGFGIHHGAKKVGATIVPISGGNTTRQVNLMRDFGATCLTCTPSYALYIAETAREMGVDPKKDLKLKCGYFGAEPWSLAMRQDIEEKLNIKAYDIFGLTEIIGPGVAAECEYQNMMHVQEDFFYPEIINPETGEPVPDGEKGELVLTTLTKTGTPILRYRTRDLTYIDRTPCKCGRTTARIHRLFGRTDDMLIIRGVNVFPSQIEEVLVKIEGVEPQYQIIVDRKDNLDIIEIKVEMNESLFSDQMKNLAATEKYIAGELHNMLNIHTKVTLVEPKSIPRGDGKTKRVFDKRVLH